MLLKIGYFDSLNFCVNGGIIYKNKIMFGIFY